jgi:2-iminobutanoate/2-iminopropanoate deaminase
LLYVDTANAPKPAGPYSQGIRAGDFVFVAGQAGKDPKTNIIDKKLEVQTTQVLNNTKAILEAAGATLSDVVKVSIFLRNISDWEAMNKIYEKYFPKNPPVRTVIQAPLRENFLIEIDVVAYLPQNRKRIEE